MGTPKYKLVFLLGTLILSFSIFVSSPLTVRAAAIQVDSNLDDALAAVGYLTDGNCTLREAIQNANIDADYAVTLGMGTGDCAAGAGNDTITFASNYTITISNNVGAGEISIISDMAINGPVTLDGNNQNRVFVINSSGISVSMDSITFINGYTSGGGGAISLLNGSLTITNGNFNNNNADGNGGAIDADDRLDITDTIFQNNTAGFDGGAIRSSSTSSMTIQTSGFMSNSAGNDNSSSAGSGGAIWHSEDTNVLTGVSTITASYFDSNSVVNANDLDNGGGAIFHSGGQLLITASAFSGNTVDGDEARGGAIFSRSTDDFALEINYSHFGETLSIPLPLPAPLNVLSLTDGNAVTNTTAANAGGGAIYNRGPMEIMAVSFIGNTSSNHGGAIYNIASTDDDGLDGQDVIIANTTFSGNTATGNGGAIYQNKVDNIIYLMSDTIADNTAANGGAIFNTGDGESPNVSNFDDISIVNTIIANNSCAGGNLGVGNADPGGNNVVYNTTCPIVQQDGSSTAATPITTDPMLQAPSLEFSLLAVITFPMEIAPGSSASGTGDPTSCSAIPVIDLDQRGLPLGIRPQGMPNCDIGAYESDQAPEINVLGNAMTIVDGDNTPSTTDFTDFGITTIGTAISRSYTIENLGDVDLTGIVVTVPANFTLTLAPAGTIAGGASSTFTIQCDAASINTFSGTVSIANNDPDENPYTFDITCQVDGIPEIDVLGNSVSIADGDATPTTTDDTDFGTTTVGTTVSKNFTIDNTGSGDLMGVTVSLPAGFSLTTAPGTTITAGNSDTFTVTCDAASANTFAGTISIANNDSDENPYTFDITCQVNAVPAPEINVQGAGTTILDGDNSPSATDDTDFGTTTIGTSVSKTFTIQNLGTLDLTGISVTLPAGFSLTTPPAATITAGNSDTFMVQCDAASVNTFSGTVSIANNDSDENPYTFDITCQVDGIPEIDVLGNATSIADGDNSPSAGDDTDFGTTTVGTSVSKTFTIDSTGTGDLTGISVTVPVGFTLTTPPAATITAGTSDTFMVQCDAASANTFTGTVSIASNDADENPYTFDITCVVNGVAEIDVQGGGMSIADGDNTPSAADDTDFGSTTIGTMVSSTFTIENQGTADLTGISITVPGGFSLTALPSTTVTTGNTTTFTVQCDAASASTFSGTVSIASNDSDENPYTFDITCNVTATPQPEMDVQGGGMSIADGDNSPSTLDDTDFGSTPVGTTVSMSYTIENQGTADLTGISVTLPSGFSLTASPSATVTAGNTTTFMVQCDAASISTFSGTVSIANDDSDENPYTFDITCDVTAIPAPEIDVLGNSSSIADGDNTPSASDFTDFGTTTIGTTVSKTFSIANTGNADLTGISVTVPAGFTLTTPPSATVAASGNTSFIIQCDAASVSTFSGTVSIASNDSDENPYTFDITCQVDGIAEIDVQGGGMSIADGDNTPSTTDDTDFGSTVAGTPVSMSYTIENQGTADLTGISVTLPAGFSLTASPSATVTAGNTTTFTVQCDAASASTFSGTVSVASNDSDENPYTFDITCNVTATPQPEMDVQGNGNSIVDGDNTPAVTDDTDFGSTPMGTTLSQTYTIFNTGTADLTGISVTVPAGFSLTTAPGATITTGSNDIFIVQCDAGSTTIFTGTVSIASNDSDENPYTFDITCNVTAGPQPEIDIQGNGNSIADGDNTPSAIDDTDFGSTIIGTPVSMSFTIANVGSADLTSLAVTLPAGFSLTASPSTTVTAGNSTTFTVQCDAASVATFSGTVSVASDDADENPYTFDITCNVTAGPTPSYNSSPFAPAASINFGNVVVGNFSNRTLTIFENGTADLDITNINITGAGFSIQTITPAVPYTIVDGSGSTIAVVLRCTPSATGLITGTLTVTHSAAGSPVDYPLTCNGTTASTGGTGSTSTGSTDTEIAVFDPAISKIGFLVPGQVGATGETLEWVITVNNVGGAAGTNVTITDTLIPELQVLRVEASGASVTITGQTVTVVYPLLNPGQSVQFSIFTLVTSGVNVSNTACVLDECATGQVVRNLPSTGETVWWYLPALLGLIGLFGLSFLAARKLRMK